MLDQYLLNKILREEKLTPEEEARLDALLAESEEVGSMVSQLEADVPSLTWRSQLNDRLQAMAPRVRKTGFAWWKFAAPAGVAAALALWALTHQPTAEPSPTSFPIASHTVEATLAQSHIDASAQFDLGGNARVTQEPASGPAELTEWNSSDLESL